MLERWGERVAWEGLHVCPQHRRPDLSRSGAHGLPGLGPHRLCLILMWLGWAILGAQFWASTAYGITYTYDDLGRLHQVVDDQGDVATYNYDAVGNILSIMQGPGTCPIDPPAVTSVSALGCLQGLSCNVTISGTSLLGASVTTDNALAPVTDCRTTCEQVTCVFNPEFSVPPGPVTLTVSTSFGSAQGTVNVLPSPSLENPGQVDFYHFAGNLGDTLTISMTRIATVPNALSTLDPVLALLDSRGFLVAMDDDSGSGLPLGPGKNAVITVTLPATDTYVLAAEGGHGTSGPYALSVAPQTVELQPGLVISTTQNPRQQTFSGTITKPGELGSFVFAANIGEHVTIEVRRVANQPDGTSTFDPAVELRDSRGYLIAADRDGGTNDPPGPGRNALLSDLPMPATDAYQLVVSGESGTTGPYELTISVTTPK